MPSPSDHGAEARLITWRLRRGLPSWFLLNSIGSSDEIDFASRRLIFPLRSDMRNLWLQSYAATLWNARVKDALEDRLRELVCDGTIRRLRPLSLIFHGNSHQMSPSDRHVARRFSFSATSLA
jgi:hypothetical protein